MTKQEMVVALYGETHRNNFDFDTALPQTLIDRIVDTLHGDKEYGHPARAEAHRHLCQSVYAYGKNGGSGMIPLTQMCNDLLQWYGEKVGYSVIYTPTIKGEMTYVQ